MGGGTSSPSWMCLDVVLLCVMCYKRTKYHYYFHYYIFFHSWHPKCTSTPNPEKLPLFFRLMDAVDFNRRKPLPHSGLRYMNYLSHNTFKTWCKNALHIRLRGPGGHSTILLYTRTTTDFSNHPITSLSIDENYTLFEDFCMLSYGCKPLNEDFHELS